MLTVAIPTFNRNHLLQDGLERLMPRLGKCELLIRANCSDTPFSTTLGLWLEASSTINVVDNWLSRRYLIECNGRSSVAKSSAIN